MQTKQIEGFRLSPQQKRIWLLEEGKNTSPLRGQCAVLIEGELKINVLKTAIQNIINQYEIFRTTFYQLPEMKIPMQVIADNYEIDIAEVNLCKLAGQKQESHLNELFNKLKKTPFDLQNQPPLQVYIIILSPKKYILMLNSSALITDGSTLKYLINKISDCYAACLQNQNIDDEPMQYADIAEWQNQLLELEEPLGKEYWCQQDTNFINDFKLWFENKKVKSGKFQPQCINVNIDNELVEKIESLTSKYHVSNSDILLACWLILLNKISNKPDLCIGILADGRKHVELDRALGLLAKYLPIACHLKSETKFSDILKQVNESVNNAWEWQEYFTWEDTANPVDFLPVVFEFTEQLENYSVADLSFSLSKQYSCIDKFKIKLTCLHQRDALVAEFHFDEELYNFEDIKTLSEQFQTLLQDAIANPEAAISQLKVLSDRQLQQLLVAFNNTTVSYPQNRCIHQLFEEQVKLTPDKIALVFEEQQLTYVQLNARANQLAHHLRQRKVGAEVLVGLYVERSLEMIVGLLGILKAGGAYVPLDPAFPPQRLALMLEDAQVQVVLTQQQLVEKLPQHSLQVICLDADSKTIAAQCPENPQTEVKPDNLVYVMFTSGSTGKPKGVAVEHRQLFNYHHAILERLELSVCNSFAHVSTFASDLGNTMIFPALCSGGCLHIISQERATNPEALGEYFHRHTIDCLKIVPAHLAALLTSAQPEQILPRKKLILGGEACSWQLIEQIQQLAPECQIFNHYGPTEATIGVLTYTIEQGQKLTDSATVPIGRAIANTQIYLLDSYLQPSPLGVPGELYIGGNNLARGYLNLSDEAEKFIPNPFNSSQFNRLYKTGDLAHYLPDGNIEFLGRIDDQVKIRGFRIELAEILSILQQHPAIQQAIVCSREDVLGDKRLVAYIVFEPSSIPHPQSTDLRSFLRAKLPEYMIPSAFVILKALPLSASGKIDREKLPAPEQVPSELAATFVAPRNQTEEAIAKIWAEVLGIEQVGIHDNFFELGGHSLLATQVISRLRQVLQVELPLRQFFDSPTVADVAVMVAQLAAQTDEAMLAEILAELEAEDQEVLLEGADL